MSTIDLYDDTTGYDQVCCPPPTHGQPPTKTSALDSAPRMVSTSNYDQGNLPTDMCDVVQDAQDAAPIHVLAPGHNYKCSQS